MDVKSTGFVRQIIYIEIVYFKTIKQQSRSQGENGRQTGKSGGEDDQDQYVSTRESSSVSGGVIRSMFASAGFGEKNKRQGKWAEQAAHQGPEKNIRVPFMCDNAQKHGEK